MRTDFTQIFPDATAAEKYENLLATPDSYWSAINRRQRRYLRGLALRAFPYRRPVQHDFACGTGRAIRILHGLVRAAHGYDTSLTALIKATEVGTHARLHQIEDMGPAPRPVPTDSPVLVTVFRFLLHEDEPGRNQAMAFAAQALPDYDAGLLVIENHGNAQSLRHLQHRRHGDRPWFAELSHRDIASLLRRHDFTIVERHGFTVLTQGWYGRRWLRPIAQILDDVITRSGIAGKFGVNVLYVARRTPTAPVYVERAETSPWTSPPDPKRPRTDPDAESW
jgi:hypothetical protein